MKYLRGSLAEMEILFFGVVTHCVCGKDNTFDAPNWILRVRCRNWELTKPFKMDLQAIIKKTNKQ